MGKTRKYPNIKHREKQRTFKKKDFKSGDGMLTSVWGPGLWHYLHTLSFNYPWHPTLSDKKYYKAQILILEKTLPCPKNSVMLPPERRISNKPALICFRGLSFRRWKR